MSKTKKSRKSKPAAKIRDLTPKKNPKGGSLMKACATGEHLKEATITH